MVKSDKPFDYSSERWIGIGDKFPKKIHNATSTSDGLMSAEDKVKIDAIDLADRNRVYDVASNISDGLLSKEDKIKLDGIETNANKYIHPDTEEIRHVTDEEKAYWNAKASTKVSTIESDGLMSKEDKQKLNGIEENATRYFHPNTHPAAMIVEDENHRFTTDEEKYYWNNKASVATATIYSDGLLSAIDKKKLNAIDEKANNYVHPNNEGVRHVTDAEKDYWNSKANKSIATNSENGLMSYKDKIKLDGIEEYANNYVHPNTPQTRHVTDEQIAYWNSRQVSTVATVQKDGLMSKEDKIKLDTIEANITTYEHPDTHPAIMIVEDSTHRFVTDEEKSKWNTGSLYSNSNPTLNDLGGIPAGTVFDNVPLTTIITRLLYPYISPDVSVSINPNGGIYEKGSSVSISKITVNITKKSENISNVEILDGTNVLASRTDGQIGKLEFSFDNLSVNTNKKFTVNVTDITGVTVVKNTNNFSFVYPYYQGAINSTDDISAALIKGLSKTVSSKGDKTTAYTMNNGRMIFAYPKSYGLLSKIIDPNQFDITNTFDVQEVQIMGLDNISVSYYVYISNILTVENYTVKFTY